MTADHAGQTGGELLTDYLRRTRWVADEPGPLGSIWRRGDHAIGVVDGLTSEQWEWGGVIERIAYAEGRHRSRVEADVLAPSRPVPVPGQALGAPLGEVTVGQAAREAAVEAALLADSPLRLGIVFGVDPSKHPEFWRRVAQVAVAALSAAPGQEQP